MRRNKPRFSPIYSRTHLQALEEATEIEEEPTLSRKYMRNASTERNDTKEAYMDLLPDEILCLIISLLATRDAVRTRILASRWKSLSPSSPNLNFDWPRIFGIKNDDFRLLCTVTSHKRNRHLFVKIVDQLLNNFVGSKIVTFRISFCLGREFCSEIDQWISFAVRLGVENLKLHFSCEKFLKDGNAFCIPVEYKLMEYYIFPCHLVHHGKESKLKQLVLQSCMVGPDLSDQFSSLVTLKLYDVPLAQSDEERILSSCLNLESLNLEWCRLLDRLSVRSLHHLTSLVVLFCPEVTKIEISAANLTTFEFAGDLANFSFLKVPNLEKLHFWVQDDSVVGYIFSHLVKVVPDVKELTVVSSSSWVEHIPDCLTAFSKVKTLELYSNGDREVLHAPKFFALLAACPLLENLRLISQTSLKP